MSNWSEHLIKADDVMNMINDRVKAIDCKFKYGEKKDSISLASYSEAKLELAELKMIFVDLILEDKQKQLCESIIDKEQS